MPIPILLNRATLLALCVFISRLLGCLRDAAFAWCLGVGPLADALVTALRLPFLARRLYNDGTFSLELTTACVREKEAYQGSSLRFALYVGLWLAACSIVLIILLYFLAPTILFFLAPKLSTGLYYKQTLSLFRLALPYIVFICIAAAATAAAHSRDHLLLPALAPIPFNIIAIGAIFLAFYSNNKPLTIVNGIVFGGLSVCLMLAPLCVRLWRTDKGQACPTRARQTALGLPLGFVAGAAPQLVFLIAAALISLNTQGALAGMFYAERLIEFPLGFISTITGIIAGPFFVRHLHQQGEQALALKLNNYVRLSLGLGLAAGAGLAGISMPLARLIYGHGLMQTENTQFIATLIVALAPSIPACAMARVALTACHARHNTKTPIQSLAKALLFALLVGAILMPLCKITGPAWASSGALALYAYSLWQGAKQNTNISLEIAPLCLYSLNALAIWLLSQWASNNNSDLMAISLAFIGSLILYASSLWLAEPKLRSYVQELFIK